MLLLIAGLGLLAERQRPNAVRSVTLHVEATELEPESDEDQEESERQWAILGEWAQEHRPSLLWQVGLRIGVALRSAEAEAAVSVPAPGDENVSLPGCALASAIRSFTFFTGIDGCTDST